ncbi:Cys-tRNA(Pro) deacylase [Collinsella sp. zg1085]|uniref:Cys-tRNA(Pro) deacylase n=1 Tax=Collinsella sp. zg1085 TaxID=2844380 RepID=UPI001C0C86AD|nr:Cys-tRNA(Pro) deacylase [Collinsella sp. zg1085]QWT18160.1 Cys-tRNA(Pro) deacylase [Collinsella sp. zg1085]
MAHHAVKKTNAMRELDRAGIVYKLHCYEVDENHISGVDVAEQLGENPMQVFKTLVCVANTHEYVACCVPVGNELNLKAAARAAGAKSLSMLPLSELLSVTGYIRGGCSPIGMKHAMLTLIDCSCQRFDTIFVSAGKRGYQLELSPQDLVRFCQAQLAAISAEE